MTFGAARTLRLVQGLLRFALTCLERGNVDGAREALADALARIDRRLAVVESKRRAAR